MPALPTSATFTGGSVTEGQFKAALTALRDYLSGLLGADGAVATALATLGAPFSSHAEKTAAYTVNLGDRGRLISASGTGGWTLSLPMAATAGAGFVFCLRNASTGNITIDPSGAELVNGQATLVVGPGGDAMVLCTNADWVVVGSTGNEAVSLPLGTVDTPALRFLTRPGVGLFSPAANVLGIAINATERMRLTTTGAQITGLLTGTAVTQSPIDTTAGRVLKTGDFGMGTAITLTASDNLDNITTSAMFYNPSTANTPGNNYPTAAAGSLLVVYRGPNNTTQVYTTFGGTTANSANLRQYVRSRGTDGWSPWDEILMRDNILGSVSQSSGVPTGAIIERSSNANGEYVRFADGTQICSVTAAAVDTTTAIGALFMHANLLTWTFPAAFAAPPVVSGGGGNAARWLGLNVPAVNSVAYRIYSHGSTGTLSAPALTAVGRWF